MRKILLLTALISVIAFSSFAISIEYGLSGEYTDNVWHLSDYDLDRLEAGTENLPFVDTADDFIVNSDAKLYEEFRLNKKLRITPSVKFSYTSYMNNFEKSRGSILGGVDVGYKPLALELRYGFYPDNYPRDYRDNTNELYPGTGEYEKFEYEKDLYKASLSWQALKKHRISGSFKYEKYLYNDYFLEYNGEAITGDLAWRGSFPGLYLDFSYGYRQFDTDDDIVSLYNDGLSASDIPSDSSYESNLISAGLTLKKIKTSNKKLSYRPIIDFSLEKRFYQGNDEYHAKREDSTITLSPSVVVYLGKNIDITLDYSYQSRTVESPYYSVPRYKEYTANSVSLGFSFRYDLFE
ncbi:MAG: hypothetical protein JXR56_03700 [Candidatus Cloacimonetes bacterium]|nr:hypothetical protein [Candidatus Cloacimonadota bacterium]